MRGPLRLLSFLRLLVSPPAGSLCKAAAIVALFVIPGFAHAANWPSWRGPNGDGTSEETDFPITWSAKEQIRWRIALPEPGNSTPIVWEDYLFLTQPTDQGQQRGLLCLDRRNGEQLWHSRVDAVELERSHETNLYCSPSPVTDGERVICWFGSTGLVCFDYAGKVIWQRPLGQIDHVFGHGSSPIIHGDLCILNFGPGKREFAVAVDKRTGEIVWRVEFPKEAGQRPESGNDIYGTWSTPVVVNEQLIFCVRGAIVALDPQDGSEIWRCRGLGPQMKASPVVGSGIVVAFGGKDSSTLAARLGGEGDVTNSHLLWKNDVAKSRLGTGVIEGDYVFVNRSNGIVECMELESGKVMWEKRLRGTSSSGATWSSLFAAGGKVYALNQAGDAFVFRASPTFKLLATNSLNEHTNSTIVGSQGNLFIRTHASLWCIGSE